MTSYSIQAKLDQIVTKDIYLLIDAGSPEEAEELARSILQHFPHPVPYNPKVKRVVEEKTTHWIPKSIEFTSVREQE